MKKIIFPLLEANKGGNILSAISIIDKINYQKFNHSILLISSKGSKNDIAKFLKKKGNSNFNTININFDINSLVFKIIFLVKLIYFFLSKNKIHIVHTNDGYLNFYFSIIKLIFGFKLILHIRNTDTSRRNFLSFFLAEKIICISKFVKNKIPSFFLEKTIVLYNYVELFDKKIKIKKKHFSLIKKIKNKNVILCVSNIHKRKKPKNFLDILEKLNQGQNKIFVGLMFFNSNQNEYNNIRNIIKKRKLEDNIFLFNNLTTHYWIPLIKRFNKKILLATSLNEPLGRNLIEATMNNIFVVANNSGAHKEIINKINGILVNIDNIENVKKCIENIFNHKKLLKRKFLTKNFLNKFQDKKYFKKIENLYE